MKKKLLFDTDVIIDYLRGEKRAVSFLEEAFSSKICYLSPISIAELYVGVRENEERAILDDFIGEFNVASLDKETAVIGGLFRRDFKKSHAIGLADALIAATALALEAHLVSLNKKYYPMISNLLIPYSKKS